MLQRLTCLFVVTILLNVQILHCANILFFWGYSGYSHRIAVWPLIDNLLTSGHNVTFLSPHHPKMPSTNPNLTEIVPHNLLNRIGLDTDPAQIRVIGGVKAMEWQWSTYIEGGYLLCKELTTDQDIVRWTNTDSYDLVIVNTLFNECGLGFAYKFKAPVIIYTTTTLYPWWGEAYGIPEENYPELQYHLPINMTFFQQVWNTITPLYWAVNRYWYYFPKLESILRSNLNIPDMPPLMEIESSVNLQFMNTHFSEDFPRSLPPSIIPVGGMHCTDKTRPLPDKIKSFIDSWDSGVIYFSFGTYMKLPLLPQKHVNAIFGAIRKFPSTGFVIKWNGGEVPRDIPENVLTAEWLAQQDILAHPNVKAFITHGGRLGIQEAIFHSVPMIVFPIFADQDYNAQTIHSSERGIMMEIADLTQDKLEAAIRDIVSNKKYKQNMEQLSLAFRDRPERPEVKAGWWIEYALRHKNTSFLRSIGVNQTWWERRQLHIWAFLGLAVATVAVLTIIIIRILVINIFSSLTKAINKTKTE